MREAAEEEDGAGGFVADEEEEGMIGTEDNGRRRAHDRGGGGHRSARGGGLAAFFVHVDEGFVDDVGNLEIALAGHDGEIGGAAEGIAHPEVVERASGFELCRDFESGDGKIHFAGLATSQPLRETVRAKGFLELGEAGDFARKENDHGELAAGVGKTQDLSVFAFRIVAVVETVHHRDGGLAIRAEAEWLVAGRFFWKGYPQAPLK